MKVIVAVDKNWGIGKEGDLLAHIKEDMKFFRETTTGQVVIMGRKTLESFPGSRPLPDRVNIVITKDKNYQVEGATVVHSIEAAVEESHKYAEREVYVIGGESVYRQMLELCDTALVTRIEKEYEADTYFPNLDQMPEWTVSEKSEEKQFSKGTFAFYTYSK